MTDTQFDKANKVIDNTIQLEGGYSNNKADKGGATNYGITLNTYRRFVNKNATIQELKGLSATGAQQFYRQYYFYANHIEELPESIWDIIFDMCVNHGPTNAYACLQLALIQLGQQVTPDGKYGPVTITATKLCNIDELRMAVINQRLALYAAILKKKPDQRVFSAGWMIRCASFVTKRIL